MSSTAQRRLRRLAGAVGQRVTRASRQGPAVVSLTFDDGSIGQRVAADLLAARGLTATFYVSSGFIGGRGNLDWDDLRAMGAEGHEIGGHTSSHPDLEKLDPAAARDEIESDRLALLEQGLDPATFAYPFGRANPTIAAAVRSAGYLAARGYGGFVESIPPKDIFGLRTPEFARSSTTADELTELVLKADRRGDWLIIPFHDAGDPDETGSSWTIRTAVLAAFLDWLAGRPNRVARVRDVVA